jgi:hypothetical protein
VELQRLLDRQAIVDVVIAYATGIDRREWDLYRSCFTDPCEFDFSTWSGRPAASIPADTWVANVRAVNGSFDATQHISANHVVRFDADDRAECVSYMQAQHFFTPDTMAAEGRPGATNWCLLGGYYTNRLVRADGTWRISRCQLNVTWQTGDRAIFDLARARGARAQ